METIYILTDYKGYFGSKYDSIPYRAGMDQMILKNCFEKHGYNVEFIPFSKVIDFSITHWQNKYILYTSSEDDNLLYKIFIEDIVLYIEQCGGVVIPSYNFLRANNNKVYMELLSKKVISNNNDSKVYGCLEELNQDLNGLKYPLVCKTAAGAMSEGVGIAYNEKELLKLLKHFSRSKNIFEEFWEIGRKIKHEGYIPESIFRKKFIVQPFIKGLDGDYKVLVYGNKYYVLKRNTRKNDFRASGSGIRIYTKDVSEGLLSFSKEIFEKLNVPNASLDVGYDGQNYYLIEFQCIYFGSFTITHSKFYWQFDQISKKFELIESASILEEEYVASTCNYIQQLVK